jgi:hypothetical protein
MTTALATAPPPAETLSKVLLDGNLAQLSPAQKVDYMRSVCESLGLNPLTKPFEFISLNGKLVMYAKRDCTEQLRKIHGVSVSILSREVTESVYVVTARAQDKAGRHDESIGAVSITGLTGEAKANALMKAETKAKRRVTLSICGLGMLDETEAEPVARPTYTPPPSRASAPPLDDATDASETTATEPAQDSELRATGKPRTAADVKPTGGPITGDQIKAIHTLRPQVGGLTEEAYRRGVAVYRQADGSRCVGPDGLGTSKLLSKDQASHLINRFEAKIQKQGTRVGDAREVVGEPPPKLAPLEDFLQKAFQSEGDEQEWLHGTFGESFAKDLDPVQSATALQLMIAMSQGNDVYDEALTKAREQGLVR